MTGEKDKEAGSSETSETKQSESPVLENKTADADLSADTSTKKETKDVASKKMESKKSPQQAATKKSSNLLWIIILLIILIGLGVGGYFGWKFWTEHSTQQEQRLQSLESYAAEQNAKVNNLAQQQSTQGNDQASVLQRIKQDQEVLQRRLDSHTQRLRALAGTSRDDWLLAEARYLLRLASQRLLVERSTEGARALLESADKILLSVDDAGVFPVRNAIAQEIIALKLAKKVDREGLYLQISALKNQIQQLPLIPFRPINANEDKPSETASSNSDETIKAPWYQNIWTSIKKTFTKLGDFVQVRQHDQAPELLISEEQQLQTVNNLMLMFEQAQFALLHGEEVIYKTSLKKALRWWKNYYSHYSEYEVIQSEIKKLQKADIIQTLPNINRSSELLTDYIEQFHKLNSSQTITKPPTLKSNTANVNSDTKEEVKKSEPLKPDLEKPKEPETEIALPKKELPKNKLPLKELPQQQEPQL